MCLSVKCTVDEMIVDEINASLYDVISALCRFQLAFVDVIFPPRMTLIDC